MNSIIEAQETLSQCIKEELERCLDPYYFYKHYITIQDPTKQLLEGTGTKPTIKGVSLEPTVKEVKEFLGLKKPEFPKDREDYTTQPTFIHRFFRKNFQNKK